ncbi:hypothetical protein [Leuconostoc carnosum]|uniref:hypothetical protein n=1 Tax=Leuconostoc carnosum TaxID=1252 RepID=UPI000D5208FE|nr:hypothetical protein [Leuconostoc carnosum]WLC58822.1 hypothetical protein HTZ88_02010 [Leuconostoc carnosum]SPJ44090.1 hypothetical protein LCAC16_80174 [Leuconostoc carnosum]
MKEIKLLNGTGIEVTKEGVLLKGNSISFETDDVSVVVVRDGNKFSLMQSNGKGLTTTIGDIDDEEVEDTDTTHVPTNHELEVWLRSIQSQVTSIEAKVSKLEAKTSDKGCLVVDHIIPNDKRNGFFPGFHGK